jgi:HK97 gp10 family phage protein
MANAVRVQISGLRELGQQMQALRADVAGRIARAATAAGANVVRKAAQQRVPVDTGNLRKNIIIKRLPKDYLTSAHIVTARKGKLTARQTAAGLTDGYYGKFVEFGTVKMPARPFLGPAFDSTKQEAANAITERLAKRLAKANSGSKGGTL